MKTNTILPSGYYMGAFPVSAATTTGSIRCGFCHRTCEPVAHEFRDERQKDTSYRCNACMVEHHRQNHPATRQAEALREIAARVEKYNGMDGTILSELSALVTDFGGEI